MGLGAEVQDKANSVDYEKEGRGFLHVQIGEVQQDAQEEAKVGNLT